MDQLDLNDQQIQSQENELGSREKQLRSLNEQLITEKQTIATLEKEIALQDKQVRELKELLTARDLGKGEITTETQEQARSAEEDYSGPRISWEEATKGPTGIRSGSSAVIGVKLYIRPYTSQTVYEFNIISKQWSILFKHPINGFTLVNINGLLVTVGGMNEKKLVNKYSSRLYIYEEEKWTETLPPMPTKRSTPGAVYANNTLVVAGGFNYEWLPVVEILNTISRQWSSVSLLPFTTSQPSICVHNDTVYIHPGYTENDLERKAVLKCSLEALAQSEPWERIAALPVHRSNLMSVHGHLIAVGGVDSEPTNNVYHYNGTTDSWTVASRMSVAHYRCLTALLPGNKLTVVGGYNIEARQSIEIATVTK